jgi:hypothetical protein
MKTLIVSMILLLNVSAWAESSRVSSFGVYGERNSKDYSSSDLSVRWGIDSHWQLSARAYKSEEGSFEYKERRLGVSYLTSKDSEFLLELGRLEESTDLKGTMASAETRFYVSDLWNGKTPVKMKFNISRTKYSQATSSGNNNDQILFQRSFAQWSSLLGLEFFPHELISFGLFYRIYRYRDASVLSTNNGNNRFFQQRYDGVGDYPAWSRGFNFILYPFDFLDLELGYQKTGSRLDGYDSESREVLLGISFTKRFGLSLSYYHGRSLGDVFEAYGHQFNLAF